MKKLAALALAVCSTLITANTVQARNSGTGITTQQHHGGDTSALSLGSPLAICISENGGIAKADVRNIDVNGHSQTVMHLKAQNQTAAQSFLNNLDTVTTIVNTPISFSVVKGNAKYLVVGVNWITHGTNEMGGAGFITPDSSIVGSQFSRLIDNGHGNYTIPLGSAGIPQGAQLTLFLFTQNANPNNCSNHASNINHLQINRSFIGIDTTADAQVCGSSCGEGQPTGAEE